MHVWRTNRLISCRKVLCLFITTLSILYVIFTYLSVMDAHSKWVQEVSEGIDMSCEAIKEQKVQLLSLLKLTVETLEKHKLPVFLLYGSIWGSIRGYNGPLPWDYDVDLGAEYNENITFQMIDIGTDLKKVNITTSSFYERAGMYKFVDKHNNIIDLFLFRSTWFNMSWRLGWEPYLIFVHYFYYHSFPYQLIARSEDLEKVKFGGNKIRIPRGGMEIMKYLYRDNWAEEKKPNNFACDIS